jgi:hypothetical protein
MTGTVKAGLAAIRTGFKNSSREYSFQEPVNETPNLQMPVAVRNSLHNILILPMIEIHGAQENEGIMKAIAEQSHLRMPSQIQVSTTQKRKVQGCGAQQCCYCCGKSRSGEHHIKRGPPNLAEFCSLPKEHRYHAKVGRTRRVKRWRRSPKKQLDVIVLHCD